MNTPITITETHINALLSKGCAPNVNQSLPAWIAHLANKANEIALAEQQESEYIEITAEEARELGAGNAEWKQGKYMPWPALALLRPLTLIKVICNLLSEQSSPLLLAYQ